MQKAAKRLKKWLNDIAKSNRFQKIPQNTINCKKKGNVTESDKRIKARDLKDTRA